MRTPEQIKNLRSAFSLTPIGAAAFLLNDQTINKLADMLERDINNRSYTWLIQVRLQENESKSWDEIKPEPKTVFCSYDIIMDKAYSLLIKFPALLAIKITEIENKRSYEFDRGK